MTELAPFFQRAPNPSLSLTSELGGAYFLIKPAPDSSEPAPKRDRSGRSIPARMALYTSKLLSSGVDVSSLPEEFQVELLYLLALTAELATDQLAVPERGGLWSQSDSDQVSAEIQEFVTESKRLINRIVGEADAEGWRQSQLAGKNLVERLINIMMQQTGELTCMALYSAKALSSLLQSLVEAHGVPLMLEEWFAKLGIMRATPRTALAAITFITGFGELLATSKAVSNLCTRLMSELVGMLPGLEKTLHSVVLLNASMSVYESGKLPVENRKQAMALKQLTSWTDTPEEMSPRLAAETCKAIYRMLPGVAHLYGPYWEQAIAFCISLWDRAAQDPPDVSLPYIYHSLKLYSALNAVEDGSDDLTEAVSELALYASQGLLELLKLPRRGNTQASQIVDELLSRIVDKIPLHHVEDLSELYGLVASDSKAIQTAAFNFLHKALPVLQEKIVVDTLLDKTGMSNPFPLLRVMLANICTLDARLPDELLSLLLDAPTLEAYPDELLVHFPTPVRAYLLAWHLVFDTYGKGSYKVRSDYTENLKAGGYVAPLLDFMFDVLGHSAAHPLNLEREGLADDDHLHAYDVQLADAEQPAERAMHWLLVHLFYQVLKHLPGPFKAWFLECRSKQTRNAVEGWMVRYFSPVMISEAMDEVVAWVAAGGGEDDSSSGDGQELVVKVSKAAREVTAGYEIDDEVASIVIRVPAAYPLETVSVAGVNRVAVREQKWHSWIMATQGVITFAVSLSLSRSPRNFFYYWWNFDD